MEEYTEEKDQINTKMDAASKTACADPNELNEVLLRINELCEKRKWSHYTLAKNSNVPYTSINNMYHRNTYPSLPILFKLCDGLRIHVSDFFLDSDRTDYSLSDSETSLISGFRSLGFHDQELLMAYLKGLQKEL